jgi:hypothetical protein
MSGHGETGDMAAADVDEQNMDWICILLVIELHAKAMAPLNVQD